MTSRGLPGFCISAALCLVAVTSAGAQNSAHTVLPSGGDIHNLERFRQVMGSIQRGSMVMAARGDALNVLAIEADGISAEAVAIPRTRLQAVTGDIVRRLNAESGDAPSALRDLRERQVRVAKPAIRTGNVFSSAMYSIPLAAATDPLDVNEAFAAGIERARLKGFDISPAQIQLLPSPKKLTAAAMAGSILRPVAKAYAATIAALGAIIDDPEDPLAGPRLKAAAETTYAEFVASWPALQKDWAARGAAIRAIDGIRRQSELKAIYGVRSEFEPKSYQAIFLQSARSVAIHDASGRIICSGLLVTGEWIMTAGHCFTSRSWQNMSATVNVPGAPATRLALLDAWPDHPRGSRPADAIDYAFVRIAPTAPLSTAFRALEGQTRAAFGQPLCIRKRAAAFEEPVVVIAQLSSDRRVYDHAYVWFPFEVLGEEFDRVSAMTGIRLHRFAEAAWPDSRHNQEVFFRENMKSLEDAYAAVTGAGTQSRRQYRWAPASATSRRPMFGFDTDTVQGNSGGAVFSRSDACLLGVFNGGQPDGIVVSESSWREHEFATPIETVLTEILAAPSASATVPAEVSSRRAELVSALRRAAQ